MHVGKWRSRRGGRPALEEAGGEGGGQAYLVQQAKAQPRGIRAHITARVADRATQPTDCGIAAFFVVICRLRQETGKDLRSLMSYRPDTLPQFVKTEAIRGRTAAAAP
jgi:hypothetical protein